MKYLLTLLFSLFLSCAAFAAGDEAPLPLDEAFAFHAQLIEPSTVSVNWSIAPGYYLYRDKVSVTFTPGLKNEIEYPQGEFQFDPNRGRYEAYAGQIQLKAMLPNNVTNFAMKVEYQGCSKGGFCYPPQARDFTVDTNAQTITEDSKINLHPTKPHFNLRSLLTDQAGVQALFGDPHLLTTLLLFVALGLFLSFTPCVLPMIPILMSIIVGQKQALSTRRALQFSVTYVLAMAFTYAVAGMLVAYIGGSVQVWLQKPVVIIVMSLLFVLLALSMFGLYELRLPHKLQNRLAQLSQHQRGGSYVGVFVMGVLSTLIVSPCVTAPLVGVLMYISQTGNVTLGGSALFAMGIGMGLPLIAIGTSAGRLLPKSGNWMNVVKKSFGVLMLGMAVWMGLRAAPLLQNTHFRIDDKFIVVTSAAQLQDEIKKATDARLPILLDFYADWCESCVTMEKQVFDHETVQTALNHFILIRADLSGNTPDEQMLMQQYQVIAPPTVLFFNNSGQEIAAKRIVGEVNEDEFMSRLNLFLAKRCDQLETC